MTLVASRLNTFVQAVYVCAGVTRQGMLLIFRNVEDNILGIKKTEK